MLAGTPDHAVDAPVPESPLCDEQEFAADVADMVADEAPRLFAVVEEYGERVDARIAAWGMSFDEQAIAVDVDDRFTMFLQSPKGALRLFREPQVTPRLVWVDPEAVSAQDDSPPDS